MVKLMWLLWIMVKFLVELKIVVFVVVVIVFLFVLIILVLIWFVFGYGFILSKLFLDCSIILMLLGI